MNLFEIIKSRQNKSNLSSHRSLQKNHTTPNSLADFMIKWGSEGLSSNADILIPGVGEGLFFERINHSNINYRNIKGIEIDSKKSMISRALNLRNAQVLTNDFYSYSTDDNNNDKFDLIITNPPFNVRKTDVEVSIENKEKKEAILTLYRDNGMPIPKSEISIVTWILSSISKLKEANSKFACLVPIHFLSAEAYDEIRNYLVTQFDNIKIVTLEKPPSPYILNNIALLLCERTENWKDNKDYTNARILFSLYNSQAELANSENKSESLISERKTNQQHWRSGVLTSREIELLNKASEYHVPLKTFGEIRKIKIAGLHKYLINKKQLESWSLNEFFKPLNYFEGNKNLI